ncbi:hypothetical protein ACFHW2_30160 [Actinomadura sp. LOL_016]
MEHLREMARALRSALNTALRYGLITENPVEVGRASSRTRRPRETVVT